MSDVKDAATCPLCNQPTAFDHCEKGECGMIRCTNVDCMGVLSPGQGLANRLDPNRVIDSKTKVIRRVRYVLQKGDWREL